MAIPHYNDESIAQLEWYIAFVEKKIGELEDELSDLRATKKYHLEGMLNEMEYDRMMDIHAKTGSWE